MFLQVTQLEVRYPQRSRAAVKNVNFALQAGEIGVFIGPSGCGKTTLLRAIAGLERVSAGKIYVGENCVSSVNTHLAPEKRRIGMVFQDYALFPHLNVYDNIAFGLHQQPHAQRDARIREVLALVGLASSAQRYPHELSGGQQQRVALARALAPKPHLLLLDEPFSNLDLELRERLALEVRHILKDAQTTALFVTHDQMEAFMLGDVIGVMLEGYLHQWADAYTLYHRPASRFVAEFIGHGTFIRATVLPRTDSEGAEPACEQTPQANFESKPEPTSKVNLSTVCLSTALGKFCTSVENCPPQVLTSGSGDVLLRVDDVEHDDAAPVQAQIMRKAFRGSDYFYELRLANGELVLARVPHHHHHQIGEWIGVRPQAEHVVVFERDG